LCKLAGYRRALEQAGNQNMTNRCHQHHRVRLEGGVSSFPLLAKCTPKVTAAICINDAIALGLMAAASDAGLRCPADFSRRFGDSPMGKYWRPALTTFALSANRVAELAVSLVMERSEGGSPAQSILVPEELIIRQSTGQAPNAGTREVRPAAYAVQDSGVSRSSAP
jgi:DNA-binding LacI/PurR family transcriptional regulator